MPATAPARSRTTPVRRRPSARRASIRRKIWLLRLQEQDRMLAAWSRELRWLVDHANGHAPANAARSLISLRMAMAGLRAAMEELADGAPPTEWLFRAEADPMCSVDPEIFKVLALADE